jgi:penicillin-binding protein 1B
MLLQKSSSLVRKFIAWSLVGGVVTLAALFVYCASLFQELELLMRQTPHLQPSVIYSDAYVLKKGDLYENTFLIERLKDLRVTFNEGANELSWQSRGFDYPEFILTSDPSAVRPKGDAHVVVKVEDGTIESIKVDDADVEAFALEPIAVAQLAGSGHEIRDYVKLPDIPTPLLQAIIAIEDQRFLEHMGFDVRSLARAVWINLRHRALSQGGSTITQQLVKNLLGSSQKTLFRKARELVLAILIEARYDKDTILEKYLNEVYVGQIGSLEIHGVAEAARYFYSKQLDQLTLSEMALIAGIIRGPAYYSPYKYQKRSLERKDTVLRKMAELKIITELELKQALASQINFAKPTLVNNRAPYFVDYVKAQVLEQLGDHISAEDLSAQGLRIFTTLDLSLQRRADDVVLATIKELEARHKVTPPLRLEGLLVAADPARGAVRALVGGRAYSDTTYNRVLNMKRQVGSTFKPIAYLAAFLKGTDAHGNRYSPAYMIDDEPWTYSYHGQTWSPRNYEKTYRGHITLREAFINSINIPMAKIATDVGMEQVVATAKKLGIKETLPAIPSLALGSVDLRPLDLLQAYTTLANRGEYVELTTVRGILDSDGRTLARFQPQRQQAFDKPVIDLLNELLSGVTTSGTAKILPQLGYSKKAHGKTGTTSFYRDAWFAGFSQGLAAVTWTGFDELKVPDEEDAEGVRTFKAPALLTGAGAALPSWARFFAKARPAKVEVPEAELDAALEHHRIDKSTGMLAKSSCPSELVYDEVFLPNTAPTQECTAH